MHYNAHASEIFCEIPMNAPIGTGRNTLAAGLSALLIAAFSIAGALADSSIVQVRVKESKLRSQPKFWASGTADLRYGDSLNVVGSEEGWLKVKTRGGASGFVHPTTVTDREIVISRSGSVPSAADRSDVVLAGKGFNREVEKEYAASNPALDFRSVDSMERYKVGSGELLSFLREGKLGNGRL